MNEKIVVFELCTFHPSGYFREESLKVLATFNTGRENFSFMQIVVLILNDRKALPRR